MIKSFLILTFFISLFLLSGDITSAASCPSGVFGTHYNNQGKTNTGARLNGTVCTSPGNYLDQRCAISSGYILTSVYCMAGNDSIYPDGNLSNPVPLSSRALLSAGEGCVETYQEQGDINNAPSICNRPLEAPSLIGDVFGKIVPPNAIQNFGFGALGISTFLSNLVVLIYIAAAIILIFMLLWGAWDWLTSGGDKEKLEAARNKLIHAIIGIVLFAVVFAIIQILGQFTGFIFFKGQRP